MFLISLTWLLLFLLLMLWGVGAYAVFVKLLGKRYQTTISLFHFSWMGFATLIGFLQIYSLFFAIDKLAVIVVYLIALISGLFSYRYILQSTIRILDNPMRFKIVWIVGVLFIIIIVSYYASLPLKHFDTDLYHLNTVKWNSKYPAIPGIVNLHHRLAFNSSFHLFAALKNHWMWKDRSVYFSNSFLLLLISIQWFSCIIKLPIVRLKISHAFVIITSPFLISSMYGMDTSSLGTDLSVALLILIIIFELLSFESKNIRGAKGYWNVMCRRNLFSWLMIISLASALLTIKLSAIPVFVLIFIASMFFFVLFNLSRNAKYICYRHLLAVYGLPAIIFLGFIARNIILSGWIFYPFPFGNLHLDWSASQQEVNITMTMIEWWAKYPGKWYTEVMNGDFYFWFIPWYQRFMNGDILVLLYSGIIGLLYILLSNTAKRFRSLNSIPLFLSIVIGALSILFWFFTAPDLRFGRIFFWVFGGASISPLIYLLIKSNTSGKSLVFCIIIFFLYITGNLAPPFTLKPNYFGLPPSKTKEVVPIVINNGQDPKLIILRPKAGEDQCGNSRLPCSPEINENSNIELRIPGQIRSGFRR